MAPKSKIAAGILIVAVLSALLTGVWSYWEPGSFALELRIASSVGATSKVYFDVGRGFNEADTSSVHLPGGNMAVVCRFLLPFGTYRSLRFDPIDCSGTATFSGMRLVNPAGRVVQAFSPQDFKPLNQISASTVEHQAVRMVAAPGYDDPYYLITLPAPLHLQETAADRWGRLGLRFALWFLLLGGAALLGRRWLRRHPDFGTRARRRARQSPHLFLAALAGLAAVAASYPVVFCGRSDVSPNNGVILLYNTVPTLPGMTDQRLENVRNTDIGALMFCHIPYTIVEHRALFRDHELPLWDRDNSCGVPLLGQGQSMLGDPLQLITLLADGASWAFDLRFVLAKALFAAGLGFIVWTATRDLTAATLVTFSAAFVGFFNYRLNHPAIFSVSVAPWVLFCWVRMVQTEDLHGAARWCLGLLLANGSLLTSGTVKEAYMLLLSLNLAGALALIFGPDRPGLKWRKWILATGTGLILILLSAPVWLTLLESLRQAYTSSDQPMAWQFPANWLIGLFDDLFYRELSVGHNVVAPSLNFFLLLGVLWAVIGFPRLRRNAFAVITAAGAVASIALVFSWVPGSLIVRLPVLKHVIHIGNTFSCVAMIFLSVLAGYGFQQARMRLAEKNGWKFALLTLLLLLGLLIVCFQPMAVFWSGHPGLKQWLLIIPVHRWFFIYLGILLAALVMLTIVAAWCGRRKRWTALPGFIALLALGVLLVRQGQHYSTRFDETYFSAPAVRADLHARSEAVQFIRAKLHTEPARVVGFEGNLLPGWSGVYNLEGISGPDALMNPWYRELMEACGFERVGEWRLVIRLPTLPVLKPVCDFLNVKYYLGLPHEPHPSGNLLQPVLASDLDVYRSATAWPRAFFTDQVLAYDTPVQLAAMIKKSSGRPFAAVQTDEPGAPSPTTNTAAPLVVPAKDYHLTANTTAFTVIAPKAGVLVLQEAWLPHSFRVTVNGRRTDYFRANHAFRGIIIPTAGIYHVIFTYRPPYWTLSLFLCGCGLILLVSGLIIYKRSEKNNMASSAGLGHSHEPC